MSFRIIGTGAHVPERVLTNDELSTFVDTSDDWIKQRVGVRQRHICTTETAADLAVEAAKQAMEMAGIEASQLGLIIAATISSDSICPTVAGSVQMALGAHCPAFDLNSACSGFLFSFETAAGFFARGGLEYALVVGAERMSRLTNWEDRSTCVIFGDGAGAAVLQKGDNYLASCLRTDANGDIINISAGAIGTRFTQREINGAYVVMKGQETFKFAVRQLVDNVQNLCEQIGISVSDLAFVVPHQANIRIIELAAKRLGLPMDKFVVNIDQYGNTSAASCAMTLNELVRSGRLKEGDLIAMCAFGGGLSSAACIIKW